MTIKEFIEELRQKDIEISFSGGKLKYSGPEENITPDIIERLKENKGKLIKYFWPEELALVMPINTEGTKPPLFIVHGDYANYVISDHLGPDQPVYGFFHPGSEGEAIHFRNVEEMAKIYLDKLLRVAPSGPYFLMGFSFGGTLAYEMAAQLQRSGHSVPFLVLLDSISPLATEPIKWEKTLYLKIRKNILRPLRILLKRQLKLIVCECYALINKPIPAEKRADYIFIKYLKYTSRYKPLKFRGNILLFRTKENPNSKKYLGWETLTEEIRLVEIKGKHLEIFTDKENTEIVKTEIENYLASASRINQVQ
jgi:thioesterase domain-containing protein